MEKEAKRFAFILLGGLIAIIILSVAFLSSVNLQALMSPGKYPPGSQDSGEVITPRSSSVCGNGVTNPPETCDPGGRCSGSGGACTVGGPNTCGGGEVCQMTNIPGCSNCQVQPGWQCAGQPSVCAPLPPPPPTGLSLLGHVPGVGDVRGMAISDDGTLAYVLSNQVGLIVVNVSGSSPVIVGAQTTPMERAIGGGWGVTTVILEDDIAVTFSLLGGDFQFISLQDPLRPQVLRTLIDGGAGGDIFGNYLYVGSNGVRVFDISDLANPQLVNTVGSDEVRGPAVAVSLDGQWLYVGGSATTGGVKIYSLANPANPQLVNSIPMAGVYSLDLNEPGTLMAVASSVPANGVTLFDLASPSAPLQVSNIAQSSTYARLDGARLFVRTSSPSGVKIYNVENPATPILAYNSYYSPWNIASRPDFMLSSRGADGLWKHTFSPAAPYTPVFQWTLSSAVLTRWSITADGNHVLVSAQYGAPWIVNVENPAAPYLVKSINIGANSGVLRGPLAYIAGDSGGLKIYNWADSATPQLLSTTPMTAKDVVLSSNGNLAYVAASVAGLKIIDVSNPSAPSVIVTYDTPGAADSVYLNGEGTILYLGDYASGLRIFDVSVPSAPQLLGVVNIQVSDFTVDDGLALIQFNSVHVTIVDISSPQTPVVLITTSFCGETGGALWDLALSGNNLAVACANGVPPSSLGGYTRLWDISNPALPVLVDSERVYGTPFSVTFNGPSQILAGVDATYVNVFGVD